MVTASFSRSAARTLLGLRTEIRRTLRVRAFAARCLAAPQRPELPARAPETHRLERWRRLLRVWCLSRCALALVAVGAPELPEEAQAVPMALAAHTSAAAVAASIAPR